MIRRPPRSTLDRSSAASDVYKRQVRHHFKERESFRTFQENLRALHDQRSVDRKRRLNNRVGFLCARSCSRKANVALYCLQPLADALQSLESLLAREGMRWRNTLIQRHGMVLHAATAEQNEQQRQQHEACIHVQLSSTHENNDKGGRDN